MSTEGPILIGSKSTVLDVTMTHSGHIFATWGSPINIGGRGEGLDTLQRLSVSELFNFNSLIYDYKNNHGLEDRDTNSSTRRLKMRLF